VVISWLFWSYQWWYWNWSNWSFYWHFYWSFWRDYFLFRFRICTWTAHNIWNFFLSFYDWSFGFWLGRWSLGLSLGSVPHYKVTYGFVSMIGFGISTCLFLDEDLNASIE
jgi:hypothetical protein